MTVSSDKRLICFAHRGASGHAPENTLAAFEKAVDLGADWIELDVYAIEGELIVFHDDRLERTTNGTGEVMQRSLDYLRGLDAGHGEKIPFLSEVLSAVGGRIKINIELKGPGTALPVVSLINHYVETRDWRYEQFLISSFDRDQVAAAGAACPQLSLALNVDESLPDYSSIASSLGLVSIHIHLPLLSSTTVRKIHQAGCRVSVFTANTDEEIARVKAAGADGVFTNFPERVVRSRDKAKKD